MGGFDELTNEGLSSVEDYRMLEIRIDVCVGQSASYSK